MKLREICIFLFFIFIIACSKEESSPEVGAVATEGFDFAGQKWQVRATDNIADTRYYCLTDRSNVRLDSEGHLILRLSQIDAIWHGAELITIDQFGFGTFKLWIEYPFRDIDRNVSFMASAINVTDDIFEGMTQAGIRYSYYGESDNKNPLSYIVYATDKKYAEEYVSEGEYEQNGTVTLHEIAILPDEIAFSSYSGKNNSSLLAKYSTKKGDYLRGDYDISFSKTFPNNKFILTFCLGEFNEPEKIKDIEIKILNFEFIPYELNYSQIK